MEHRIRAAAAVVRQDKVLLVRHDQAGRTWLNLPGGALEAGEDIFACAVREVQEETGLTIKTSRIVYLQEFIDHVHQSHNFEIFVLADSFTGQVAPYGAPPEEEITEARFYSRAELKDFNVYPNIIKEEEFWQDVADDFPQVKYLGQQSN